MHGGGFIQQSLGIHDSVHWYIVMDLMDGNLSELIHSNLYSELTWGTKINIAIQICNGLAHLHYHKIIHRDIKPENVLVSYLLLLLFQSLIFKTKISL